MSGVASTLVIDSIKAVGTRHAACPLLQRGPLFRESVTRGSHCNASNFQYRTRFSCHPTHFQGVIQGGGRNYLSLCGLNNENL